MQVTNPNETELTATATAQIQETLGQIYDIIDVNSSNILILILLRK